MPLASHVCCIEGSECGQPLGRESSSAEEFFVLSRSASDNASASSRRKLALQPTVSLEGRTITAASEAGWAIGNFHRQQDRLHRARERRGPPGRRVGRERRSGALDPRGRRSPRRPAAPWSRPEPPRSRSRSADDRARLRNGDLVVEVYDNHEERFVRSRPSCVSSGRTARSCSARAFPISRRLPSGATAGAEATSSAVRSRSTPTRGSASTGSVSTSTACWTRRGPSSTSSSATPRSRCRSRSPAGATGSCGTCRASAASSWAPTARGGSQTQPGRSTTG